MDDSPHLFHKTPTSPLHTLIAALTNMLAPFFVLAALTSVAYSAVIRQHATEISCGDATQTGPLYYEKVKQHSADGRLGINKYKGGDLIAKYPGQYVAPFTVQSIPCNSSYLNLTTPSASNHGADTPVKLVLVEEPSKCLAIADPTEANSPITVVDCSNADNETQNGQFWSQSHSAHKTLVPIVGNPSVKYVLEFDRNNVSIANPPHCFDGQTCQHKAKQNFFIDVNN